MARLNMFSLFTQSDLLMMQHQLITNVKGQHNSNCFRNSTLFYLTLVIFGMRHELMDTSMNITNPLSNHRQIFNFILLGRGEAVLKLLSVTVNTCDVWF